MTPYDMIKAQLGTIVPFQNYVGVELLELADGTASAQLEQRDETTNHIKTQHAGAMFTLGEAASGAAMAAAFMPTPDVTASTKMPAPQGEFTAAQQEKELEENISALWANPARFLN